MNATLHDFWATVFAATFAVAIAVAVGSSSTLDDPIECQWPALLRDLIPVRQIRVRVVFPFKARRRWHRATLQRRGGQYRGPNRGPVQDR